MRYETGRDFQAVGFRRVAHQASVIAAGPDTMALVEEQSLRIDGADAADVAALAGAKIIDDEMIARIADGIEQAALFVVQQAAAALLGDERIPPKNAVVAGIESQQRGAAKATLLVVPGVPRRINGQIDRRPGKMRRHIQHAVMRGGREAVMEFALRRAAGVAGIVYLFGEVEEVVEVVALLVVADRLDYAAGDALSAGSRVDAAVGPDGKRPAGVGVRMTCERVPFDGVRLFSERGGFC